MNIIIMLLLISLLIIVHELGHFLASKMFGLRISKFGLGLPFGPTLYKKKFGHTTFIIHSFLLGGYVSFPDDNAPENKKEFDDEDEEKLPDDSPMLFKNKNGFQQAIILSAGVIFNVVFAIILTFATALYYGKLPSGNYEVKVHSVMSAKDTSNIAKKGIKTGDIVYSLNGIKITSYQQFFFIVQNSKPYDGYVSKSDRDRVLTEIIKLNNLKDENETLLKGQKLYLPKTFKEEKFVVDEDTSKGFKTYKNKQIKLNKKELALNKELRGKNSVLLAFETTPISLANAISDNYKPLDMVVLRNGKKVEFKNLIPDSNGVFGIRTTYKQFDTKVNSPKDAISATNKYIIDNTRLMLSGLCQLITGKISMNDMHGIVAITKIGGDIIEKKGFMDGLLLTSLISINLAIFNILPIPALDGGQLFFLILEKITRRKFDESVMEKVNSVFFYALLALMIFIVFNDISAIITKKF